MRFLLVAAIRVQPVAHALRVGIADQNDVVSWHEMALAALHEVRRPVGKVRQDIERHVRQHEAEEHELRDRVADRDRGCDQQDVAESVFHTLA
jgi:hypothetical protein